jgi:hypothetical protein
MPVVPNGKLAGIVSIGAWNLKRAPCAMLHCYTLMSGGNWVLDFA